MTTDNSKKIDKTPIIEILQKIQAGNLDPSKLPKETRQACVEVLLFEGQHHSSIASILKTSDRTIRRDVVEIRKKNSLQASPELTEELVGDLLMIAKSHYMRLKQLARSKNTSPGEMLKAEYTAWKVIREAFEKLNSIGFFMVVTGQKSDAKIIDLEPGLSEDGKKLREKYKALGPMDREKLIERLRQDTLRIAKEEADRLAQEGSPSPENK